MTIQTAIGKAHLEMQACGDIEVDDGMFTALQDGDAPPYLNVIYTKNDGLRTVFDVSGYDTLEFLVASMRHGQTLSRAGQIWTRLRKDLYIVNYSVKKSEKSDRIGNDYGYRKSFSDMAEQSTSQQDDQRMVNIILANVGTVVCFRTGNPADEQALLQMFTPYIEQGEIANLPTFNYYVRIAAVQSQEPLSGKTLLLDDKNASDMNVRQAIIDSSRKNYAIEYTPKVAKPAKATQQSPTKKKAPANKMAAASSHRRKLPGEE